MITSKNTSLSDTIILNYLRSLVGQFYKILPIKESGEPSLAKYMDSLQREMLGISDLLPAIGNDELYLSLLAILQYLSTHDCDVGVVRCEVFKSINICKKLYKKYASEEV